MMISKCLLNGREKNGGGTTVVVLDVVVTVTEKPVACPETATCIGAIVVVEAGIGSEDTIATVPEKPFAELTCKLKVALSPALTVAEVEPFTIPAS